jgi:hypothetical protein
MDDVAECEIPWDEISLGERIGLGTATCSCCYFYDFISTVNLDNCTPS